MKKKHVNRFDDSNDMYSITVNGKDYTCFYVAIAREKSILSGWQSRWCRYIGSTIGFDFGFVNGFKLKTLKCEEKCAEAAD